MSRCLLRPEPIYAQTRCLLLCHHLPLEGGSVLQSTEAELSYGMKPPHPALPKGPVGLQHLRVISQGCWGGITPSVGLGGKAGKRKGPSARRCTSGSKAFELLYGKVWDQAFEMPSSGIPHRCHFPLSGMFMDVQGRPPSWAPGPVHSSEMQVLAGSGHCAHPMDPLLLLHTPELFAFAVSTRDGSDHVVWEASRAPLGSARLAPCTKH